MQYVTEDTLVGPVSGATHYNGGKLLGIPPMEDENGNPTSTGSTQFQYVKELIIIWNIKDNIRAVSFDTAAFNTGIFRGAATRKEAFLNRRVFCLACRHHVHDFGYAPCRTCCSRRIKGRRTRHTWL